MVALPGGLLGWSVVDDRCDVEDACGRDGCRRLVGYRMDLINGSINGDGGCIVGLF